MRGSPETRLAAVRRMLPNQNSTRKSVIEPEFGHRIFNKDVVLFVVITIMVGIRLFTIRIETVNQVGDCCCFDANASIQSVVPRWTPA